MNQVKQALGQTKISIFMPFHANNYFKQSFCSRGRLEMDYLPISIINLLLENHSIQKRQFTDE